MFFTAENEIFVDFVGNNFQAVFFADFGKRDKFAFFVYRPRRITRRIYKQRPRLSGYRVFKVCRRHFIAVFFFRGNEFNLLGIRYPVRRRNDYFVALVYDCEYGVIQRTFRAVGNHYIFRAAIYTVFVSEFFGYRRSEFGYARRRGIFRKPLL